MADDSPVTVSLRDLEAGTVPFSALEAAFGPSSLGIILVKDLPSHFIDLRHRLLSYASILANLPPEELAKLENPSAKWLVGWSLGRETLKNGVFDTQKGSYYVNCTSKDDSNPPPALDPSFPEYTSPNIWPDEHLLPGFRETFESLCALIIDTAVLVARACDRYAESTIPDYRAGCLEQIVRGSRTTKARLLHYFPPPPSLPDPSSIPNTDQMRATDDEKTSNHDNKEDDENKDQDDDWCTTHLDHGCLTGLTSAMYIDETNFFNKHTSSPSSHPPSANQPPSPDFSAFLAEFSPSDLLSSSYAKAGLYILSRTGTPTKITIQRDQLAFQTGEALQVITKGRFMAVPHFVRGPSLRSSGSEDGQRKKRIARNTLAVFTQPNLDEIISYQPSPNQEAVGEKEQKNNDNDAKKDKENNENELEKTTNENRKGITFGEFAREIVTRNQPVQDITASS